MFLFVYHIFLDLISIRVISISKVTLYFVAAFLTLMFLNPIMNSITRYGYFIFQSCSRRLNIFHYCNTEAAEQFCF